MDLEDFRPGAAIDPDGVLAEALWAAAPWDGRTSWTSAAAAASGCRRHLSYGYVLFVSRRS